MFNNNRTSKLIHSFITLMLVSGVFGTQPMRAGGTPEAIEVDSLNADRQKTDESTPASFQAGGWDAPLSLSPASSLPQRAIEAFAPLASSTIGNWSALGSNLAGTDGAISNIGPLLSEVNSFVVSGTDVYVGGCFQNAGGDPTADYIAKWDTLTASWSGIGSDGTATPNGALKNCIRALAVDGDDVYVGGYPTAWNNGAPAPQATYLAKWNGTNWSGLIGTNGSYFSDQATSFAISGNNVYVGGYSPGYIYKWDTLTGNWSTLGGSNALNAGVDTMKLINSDLYVGGGFTAVYNGLDLVPEAAYIAKWDTLTGNWSALGSNGNLSGGPLNGAVFGLASDGTNLYVAGIFEDVNNYGTTLSAADFVAKWDTTTENWSALGNDGAGNGSLNFYPVAIQVNGSDIYVGGLFTDVNNNGTVLTAADYIARWDTLTENWSALGSNGSGNGSLNGLVYGLALAGDNLLVGGHFTDVNNTGTVLNTADYVAAYGICTSGPITVQNADDSGPGSLRQAIADICSGGTINFNSSLAGQTITLSSTLVIDKNLTIDGSSLVSEISISGNNSVRVFIVNSAITATINNLIIQNGNSTGAGGGMYNSGFLTVANSIFFGNNVSNNISSNGGAIANYGGTLIVTDSLFIANTATYDPDVCCGPYGGAIYSESLVGMPGALTVTNSIFDGNDASRGGAIACLGTMSTMTLTNSTYSSNTALAGSNGDGGAIFDNGCNSTIINSTFSTNNASNVGGAIFANNDINPIVVTNSTFYGNTATGGGGISNNGGLIVSNSTFSDNNASNGGAIRNALGGILSLRNSILANSAGGVDCIKSDSTPAIENINNLIETTGTGLESCGVPLLSSEPVLGLLANNGGFTQTMALLPGSPAFDAGNDTVCASSPVSGLDQRGVVRPQGSHCDIGAYEAKGIRVSLGGAEQGYYFLAASESQRKSYPGVNNGPVEVTNLNGIPVIAAERVIYKVNGTNTSFSEMMGLPNSLLNTIYWLPWYNNVDLDTQLRFGNVSGSTATVRVYIGGVEMTSGCTSTPSLAYPYVLGTGASIRVSCAGVNNGPVKIESTGNIVAAERVIYNINGINTSFSEMMALPNGQLSTVYWLPWYNNVGLDTQLRFGNVSGSSATVRVYIGGVEMTTGCTSIPSQAYPYVLGIGASIRVSCTGINNGPVQIVSNVNIVAAERVIYNINGTNTSFSELMALPNGQLNTIYWLPWYNNVDLDTQLRFGNVSGVTATVRVYIGGVEMISGCTSIPSQAYPYVLANGASLRVSCAGVNNGPVKIESTGNIVAAERVIYKVNGVNTSFSEMMGLANNLLDVTYWLPWYNNVDLDTQLRFGVP